MLYKSNKLKSPPAGRRLKTRAVEFIGSPVEAAKSRTAELPFLWLLISAVGNRRTKSREQHGV